MSIAYVTSLSHGSPLLCFHFSHFFHLSASSLPPIFAPPFCPLFLTPFSLSPSFSYSNSSSSLFLTFPFSSIPSSSTRDYLSSPVLSQYIICLLYYALNSLIYQLHDLQHLHQQPSPASATNEFPVVWIIYQSAKEMHPGPISDSLHRPYLYISLLTPPPSITCVLHGNLAIACDTRVAGSSLLYQLRYRSKEPAGLFRADGKR